MLCNHNSNGIDHLQELRCNSKISRIAFIKVTVTPQYSHGPSISGSTLLTGQEQKSLACICGYNVAVRIMHIVELKQINCTKLSQCLIFHTFLRV